MAESDASDCPCSNVSIMQLFHHLKQRYPTVPDQIVSKIIQQNFHDRTACETVLDKESQHYGQSYPGALISGGGIAPSAGQPPLCTRCPMEAQQMVTPPRRQCLSCYAPTARLDPAPGPRRPSSFNEKLISLTQTPIGQLIREVQAAKKRDSVREEAETEEGPSEAPVEVATPTEGVATCWSVCENGRRCDVVSCAVPRPGSLALQPSTPLPTHNYQVAVECSLQPWTPALSTPTPSSETPPPVGAAPRSFTRVNLTLRPPSSEPQPPIEIQSGQGLTYTTASYDPRQGFQSQLQIRIGPGGGGTVSACRTHVVSPLSPSPTAAGGWLRSRSSPCSHRPHHIKVLLERQRERRDLLSMELKRERVKLQAMQSEVKGMKLALEQKPSPDILPKLQAEIIRLRGECKRLTQAVDRYSDNSLPLGETDEEFYRNIYTGQRLMRSEAPERGDATWSCHVCTFRNHELLTVCEECEMPRLMSLGRRNILIHVTHHCPPSRTVNSWVV